MFRTAVRRRSWNSRPFAPAALLPHRYLTVFGQHDALAGHFRDPELGELGVEVFLGLASVSLAGALPDLLSSEAHGDPPHLAPLER